jgi:hypothetical protein
MTGATPKDTSLRAQYEAEWSAHVKRLDAKVQLLRTLKLGTELLLLTCAFLLYYLITCMVQAISLL